MSDARPSSPGRLALACAVSMLAGGCTGLRSADSPMYTQLDASQCVARADTLVVLLPGVYSNPDEFVREDFVKAVQDARVAADVVRVDAHLGYYEKNVFVDRLRRDVIAPARAHGYRAIWIVGISLGGFGGLVYAQEHPQEIAGVVALAPYLGAPAIADDVAKAGGLARWTASANPSADRRTERETALWTGFKRSTANAAISSPQLWLGYGRADRFAAGNGLLGAALPADRVFTTDGGHDWAPWSRLWTAMLSTLPLSHCPG